MAIATTCAYVVVLCIFPGFKKPYMKKLRTGSQVAQTARRRIEYALIGEGPVVMLLHGTPGDYTQNLLFMKEAFIHAGFSILSISQPGFHRTPIETGTTLKEQAEALVQLLYVLEIEQVASVGISCGGPLERTQPDQNTCFVCPWNL